MTRLALALTVAVSGFTAGLLTARPATHGTVLVPLASREPELRASRGFQRPPLPAVSRRSLRGASVGQGPRLHALATVARLHWSALAHCESTNNPHAVDPTGTYYGLYQFDLSTWAGVGGHGNPADATSVEQTYRAELLFARRGRAPWPVCGVWL